MSSPTIDLRAGQGRLFMARDLMEDEEFVVEYSLDAPSSWDCRFSPLVLDGDEVRLTEDSPTWIAFIPGYYRIKSEDGVEEATVEASDPFPLTVTKAL